jgi:hypothetical protein
MGIVQYFKTTRKTNMKLKMWPHWHSHIWWSQSIWIGNEWLRSRGSFSNSNKGTGKYYFVFSLETCTMLAHRCYENCSNETRSRALLGGRKRGLEVGIPLTHQFLDAVAGPLLQPLRVHYRGPRMFFRHKSSAPERFLEGDWTRPNTWTNPRMSFFCSKLKTACLSVILVQYWFCCIHIASETHGFVMRSI